MVEHTTTESSVADATTTMPTADATAADTRATTNF